MGALKDQIIGILERLEFLADRLEESKAYYKEQDKLLEELLKLEFREGILGSKRYYFADCFAESNTRWKATKQNRWELRIEDIPKR